MPVLAQDLRNAVLEAAVEGKLTTTNPSDTSIEITISNIKNNKLKLLDAKKIYKDKKLVNNEIELFNIKDTWKFFNLQDISYKITDGEHKTPKRVENYCGYYLLSARNITNEKILLDDVDFVDKEEYNKISSRCNPKKGDVLISCSGSVGRCCVVDDDNKYAMVRSAAMINAPDINSQYLKCAIISPFVQKQISKLSKQTAQANLFQAAIASLIIPLPPIEEQQRIVDTLNQIMPFIDEYEKLEKQLVELKEEFPDDLKQAVLQAAMEGKLTEQLESDSSVKDCFKLLNKQDYVFDIPDSWGITAISNVSNMYTGNSISAAEKKARYTGKEEGYNYIGTKDVGFDHSINYENGVKIPFNESKFKIAKSGSTLLCIEGGSAGKKYGMLSQDVCFGNKLCSFNASKYLDEKFQYYVIQSPVFMSKFRDGISGMIGGVSQSKLKSILIPIPPIEEQQRIVDKLDRIMALIDGLKGVPNDKYR